MASKVTSSAKPKEYNATGDSRNVRKNIFCGTCGSALYTELEAMSDMIYVKAGRLDDGKADLETVGVEF